FLFFFIFFYFFLLFFYFFLRFLTFFVIFLLFFFAFFSAFISFFLLSVCFFQLSFCFVGFQGTILGGKKGFTVLDAQKDWRFENNPAVQSFGHYFYAGAPIMAPNLDGSQEAEQKSCPLGSLCVGDYEPQESFSVEDHKKLVYIFP
ncbi:hypothetical protein PSHT_06675, partial [Puccinia striiformis]